MKSHCESKGIIESGRRGKSALDELRSHSCFGMRSALNREIPKRRERLNPGTLISKRVICVPLVRWGSERPSTTPNPKDF
ncbi:MAG: hypothetical protein ICV55_03695 [Coleofasciculus sp. C3-bin4]|nr:hypothetical protein [Coleofasciculus sp. C3-bin4]